MVPKRQIQVNKDTGIFSAPSSVSGWALQIFLAFSVGTIFRWDFGQGLWKICSSSLFPFEADDWDRNEMPWIGIFLPPFSVSGGALQVLTWSVNLSWSSKRFLQFGHSIGNLDDLGEFLGFLAFGSASLSSSFKGQLILKCPFGVFKSSIKPTKFFPWFLP